MRIAALVLALALLSCGGRPAEERVAPPEPSPSPAATGSVGESPAAAGDGMPAEPGHGPQQPPKAR